MKEPYYSENGDMLVWWLSDEESYTERADPHVFIHRSFKTKRITGIQIEDVKAYLRFLMERNKESV